MRGDLNTALSAQGIEDILDFKMFPFGNAFFANAAGATNTCDSPYTHEGFYTYYNTTLPNPNNWTSAKNGRSCWQTNCGSTGSWTTAECTAGTAVSQHGPGEGLADTVEACVMDLVGGNDQWLRYWPFVYCFEAIELSNAYPGYAYGSPTDQADFYQVFGVNGSSFSDAIALSLGAAETCANQVGLNWTAIEACCNPTIDDDGQMQLPAAGEELTATYAWKTAQLDPPHEFTPWIVFNGQPLWLTDDDAGELNGGDDLLNWICAAYTGSTLPAGCPANPTPLPSVLVQNPTPSPTAAA